MWVQAGGIQPLHDLKKAGAVEAYWQIKQAGYNTNLNLFYALAGAVSNTHWNKFSHDEKHRPMIELRPLIHIVLHFAVPAAVAKTSFREIWLRAWIIMSVTILVDLDHLLATPLYDPNRCSIGTHPLHMEPLFLLYFLMLFIPRLGLVGLGLLIHMALDGLDCYWMRAFS